ncbi:hypothetical protein D3C79_48710 [compost metagenome]
MIELLAGGGAKGKTYFPDSGPGEKTLVYGNEELGYFGTLTVDEFMDYSELRRQLKFFLGTTQNSINNEWVKAIYNKKVIFFPRKYIASSIGWNMLYDSGLIHGVDNSGAFQSVNGPVNQQRLVSAKGSTFRVRVFASDKSDPTTLSGSFNWGNPTTQPQIDINLSELGSMVNSLKSGAPINYPGPRWAVLAADSLFNGVNGIAKQTVGSNNLNFLGAVVGVGVGPYAKATNSYAWLPVLELVPSTEVIIQPAVDIESRNALILEPVVITEVIQNVGLRAIRNPSVVSVGPEPVHSVSVTYS